MSDKLHKTKGIVLRAVKYGETSMVVSIFTELFGQQSYLVNGVRKATKKGSGKAIIATAHKFLGIIYRTLKNNWVFADFPNYVLAEG